MTDSSQLITLNPLESKDTRSGFGAGLLELGTTHPDVVALCADLTGSLKMGDFKNAEKWLIECLEYEYSGLDSKAWANHNLGKIQETESDIIEIEISNQYYNMKEKVVPVMHIVDIAEEVMKDLNIIPLIKPIRGGTDGSQLSFMGLPCPNIFAGGHNFHGRYEYVPVESMMKATEVIVGISEKVALKFKN